MRPDQIALDYWLTPVQPEEMPMLAARLLAEGHDSPALRDAAALAPGDDPQTIRDLLQQALAELGVWIPDRAAAEQTAAVSLARALLDRTLSTGECASRVRRIWDFDDVIYPALPPSIEELVLMSWLHGDDEPAALGVEAIQDALNTSSRCHSRNSRFGRSARRAGSSMTSPACR